MTNNVVAAFVWSGPCIWAVGITLSVKVGQHVNVKVLAKLGKSATETYNLLMEVYGDECLSHTLVFERFKIYRGKVERLKTIHVPVSLAHQKQKLTLKKSVRLFKKSLPEHSSSCWIN
jgi:hypothetical protein